MQPAFARQVGLGMLGAVGFYVVLRKIRQSLKNQADDESKDPKQDLPTKTPETKLLTHEEVLRHCTLDDCWIIIDGSVYDVTEFALSHPGGPELIQQCAGRDATLDFLSVHPPEYAWEYVGPAVGTIQTSLIKGMPPPGIPAQPLEGPSFKKLRSALRDEVLTVTGGFGAMVQRYMREQAPLTEADYRSCTALQNHPEDLFGNHDVLALTRPDVVKWVYRRSMEGCNIVGTSTFNTQRISQEEYGIEGSLIYTMAKQSAELAKGVLRDVEQQSGLSSRFVGGQIGPTTKTACVAVDVADPSVRNTDFDELSGAYKELVAGMVDGGVDLVMVDCAFDSLNVKAALYAMEEVFAERGRRLPVMVSMSLVDDSGRTLSGQTVEAFYASVRHARPMTVGFNCGAGPQQMGRYLDRMSAIAECFTHAYPNAGLPNAEGCYDLEPEPMAAHVGAFARNRRANVVGGCCGAGPAHLRAISDEVDGNNPAWQCAGVAGSSVARCGGATPGAGKALPQSAPAAAPRDPSAEAGGAGGAAAVRLRVPSETNNGGHFDRRLYPPGVVIPSRRPAFLLCGTEEVVWGGRGGGGGRTGLECSLVLQPPVADTMAAGVWRGRGEAEALRRLRRAAGDAEAGCLGLSISMKGRSEGAGGWGDAEVVRWANLVQGEPALSRRPLVVKVEPLDAAGQATLVKVLKCLQGRSLVDLGAVLRPGGGTGGLGCVPESLVELLREIRWLGNSVLVDAPSSDLRGAVAGFEALGFARDEVVLAVPPGTRVGREEAAVGIVTAIRVEGGRASLPPVPRGVGEEEWVAAVARAHKRRGAGGAMLVLAATSGGGQEARCAAAAEAAAAKAYREDGGGGGEGRNAARASGEGESGEGREGAAGEGGEGGGGEAAADSSWALQRCVEDGEDAELEAAVESALAGGHTVDSLVNGPLMAAMRRISDAYSSGACSLPVVLKSSRVLKLAVAKLQAAEDAGAGSRAGSRGVGSAGDGGGPRAETGADAEREAGGGQSSGEKVVLATVKGDVHDLGKTIVGILLRCNGYRVVDLGRNVELADIAEEAAGKSDGERAALVGLSGMISPSLGRMVEAVKLFRERGLECPVLVGGSATSSAFCALFLDVLAYPGGVFRIADGPRSIMAAGALLRSTAEERREWALEQQERYEELREQRRALREAPQGLLPLAEARGLGRRRRAEWFPAEWEPFRPAGPVGAVLEEAFSVTDVLPLVNWTYFFQVFNLQGRHPYHTWPALLDDPETGSQARALQADLDKLIAAIPAGAPAVRCAHGLFPARAIGDDLHVWKRPAGEQAQGGDAAAGADVVIPLLRQQTRECMSLVDFVSEGAGDVVGAFACSCAFGEGGAVDRELGFGGEEAGEYWQVLLRALAARLVEAGAEVLHCRTRARWYEAGGEEAHNLSAEALLQEKYSGIRPAVGYPSMPDQRVMGSVWELLELDARGAAMGMAVTESFGLHPEASIAGLMFSHPRSAYFSVGRAADEQVADYARRAHRANLSRTPHGVVSGSAQGRGGSDRRHDDSGGDAGDDEANVGGGTRDSAGADVEETKQWLVSILA